ncbi:MAG: hypothetical protein WBV06_16145, partial [Acidimicrobiia bacterium]
FILPLGGSTGPQGQVEEGPANRSRFTERVQLRSLRELMKSTSSPPEDGHIPWIQGNGKLLLAPSSQEK